MQMLGNQSRRQTFNWDLPRGMGPAGNGATKYDKMYESKKDEIDFLQTTVSQLNTTLDESQKKIAEKELHFRRKVDENLAEIGDLRGQLAELKTTLEEGTSPIMSQSASSKKSEDSKTAFDFDTSMLVDEYEKCMRDMQDKIDEQNMTINSLIDQMDTRVAPDGEESKEDVDDEGRGLTVDGFIKLKPKGFSLLLLIIVDY